MICSKVIITEIRTLYKPLHLVVCRVVALPKSKGGENLYEKFETLLNEKGITAYRISKDIGISRSTLYDWKVGRYTPKIDKLKKIADYFGVSVEVFT